MSGLKKRLWVGLLLLVMVVSLPGLVAAGSQDFTLVNKSPYKITGFWVSPADSDNWEENMLSGDSLLPNESLDITFDNSNNVRWWNFRVKDSNGKAWVWTKKKYDLTKISEVTFYYNNSGVGSINYK